MTLPRPPSRTGIVFLTEFGSLACDATPSESYTDSSDVTQHRIENGSMVTDHVHRQPRTYNCQAHFTDTPVGSEAEEGRAERAYALLRSIHELAEPITITAGRLVLRNMVLRSISLEEGVPAKDALDLQLEFVEIVQVSSQRTFLPEQAAVSRSTNRGQQNTDAADDDAAELAARKSGGGSTALASVVPEEMQQRFVRGTAGLPGGVSPVEAVLEMRNYLGGGGMSPLSGP